METLPPPMLAPGDTAPDFTLRATPDQSLSLTELRGAPVVLVFYPADWSEVCGDELEVFNLALPLFRERHATVVGISVDSAWSHAAFRADRHLHFTLLSDFEPKGEVSRRYGVYDPTTGTSERAIFLIDADGTIAWAELAPVAVNPGADGVLDALSTLSPAASATPA